jgi:hypothetical protein
MSEYDGKQFVGIDLHRQRSVLVCLTESGERLSAVRIVNDPVALGLRIEKAGPGHIYFLPGEGSVRCAATDGGCRPLLTAP